MVHASEYHISVRSSFSLSVAVVGAFAVALIVSLPAFAQINGAPTSVTSPGFGGRSINGPRSSVTSLGPQGFTPRPPLTAAGNRFHHYGRRHHRQDSDFAGPVWYAVPVPYAMDTPVIEDQPYDDDEQYQGGPTVFDRRGSGAQSYIPPVRDAAPAHSGDRSSVDRPSADGSSENPAPPAEPPLPPTSLVFKDSHTLEVGNYAIVGQTLYDLTPGHPRRIPISDLDLEATQKANEDRGVTFQLPQPVQAN